VLERSARAYQSWRTTAKDERVKVLLRVSELYKERIDDLAALITREMGKPTREAQGEILRVASIYRYYANQGPALLEDTPLSPRAGGTALVRKEPIGPFHGIMPWNFPTTRWPISPPRT
jgi:succinate-semialdehyde dehydrogenase / glutarate-semialdehyde dehydrogenase